MGGASLSEESIAFVKNRFAEYYNTKAISLPDRFGRREFAFLLFNAKGMYRHLAFEKRTHFAQFVKEKEPAHIYYSSAYYQHPDAPTMHEKTWMGAELIFDLDSDHLPGAERMSYEESLRQVKKEFAKLVNDFLLHDFGFDEKYVDLYFSGGRGYHCHVTDPKVLQLDSNERREIVDYITGRDLKDSLIFHQQATGRKNYGRQTYASGTTLKMPTPDEPGWRGRISRGIIEIVNEIKNSDNPVERLQSYGVKKAEAERLLQDLSEERVQRIKEGKLDQSRAIRKFFLNNALRKTAVSMSAGETDEPVTCDIKRLIRLPGSLHGKTGFQVAKIPLDNLAAFDPLNDAVVCSDKPVSVDMSKPAEITIKNETFSLKPGGEEVPTYLAVFLIGRKMANIM
ncbi:MAG: DNA primase catalytic subunit PriS [Candidatus Thermoplasmatota archaeon]|nr:DNA primase catalytic subunit PriS [Candidatus Thermoplasmatota archaeon]